MAHLNPDDFFLHEVTDMARKRMGKRGARGGQKGATVVSPFSPPMGKGRKMKKRGGRK